MSEKLKELHEVLATELLKRVKDPDAKSADLNVARQFLKDNNIDGRVFFYPLSSLPMFKEKKENIISYNIFNRGINLPSYHEMTNQDIEKVTEIILNER